LIEEMSMKKLVPILAGTLVAVAAGTAAAATLTVTVNAIDASGVGAKIGMIELSDTAAGLRILPRLTNLPPGQHGIHVHVNPNCGAAPGPDGQAAAGFAAGGHFDPAATGKHLGPLSTAGHKGDLPVLVVDADGNARQAIIAPHLTVAEVKGHAIMIHAGGDNYSDQPAPLGGGGARIACAVVK
jgi:Cu-Zn family superoxide dismutase